MQRSSAQSKALTNVIGARQMTDAMCFFPRSLMVMGTRFVSQTGIANVRCREMLPDPEFMEQCIRDTLAQMRSTLT